MDPRIQILIRRLQIGPYDTTAFGRIREELTALREEIAASGDQQTLKKIIDLIDKWSQSTRDQAAASIAQFEAGSLCEFELKDINSALQRYTLSLELHPGNMESFGRIVPLLRNQRDIARLETILNQQASALANFDSVEPSFRVEVLREIANLGSERNRNLDGAIQALEEIVNLEPDLSDVKELARLRSLRGQPGDVERAADLFFTIGDVLGAPDGMEMVSKALDLNPAHEDALGLLEQWTPQQEHFAKLKYRWIAYLEQSPSGVAADQRRCALAQAYGESNEFQKGLDCIAPLIERGDNAAKEIHIKLRAGLEVAKRASQPRQPAASSKPQVESRPPHRRRMKQTMVGYKVDAPSAIGGSAVAAPKQPFAPPAPQQPIAPSAPQQPFVPAAPQAQRFSRQPPSPTADHSPPKPPAVAAVPVPASALIRPNEGQTTAVVQENSGSYQHVEVYSQPPGAVSESPMPFSLPPEQLVDSLDETMQYESQLRKRSRLPWLIGAGIVLLSATGFAAYQLTSSEGGQESTKQEPTEPVLEKSSQPAESVATAKPDQEKKAEPPAEEQPSPIEKETPAEAAEPSEKSAAIEQKAQEEETPEPNAKVKKSRKKRGPVVELITKRARFKGGKIDKTSVYDLLEKNMPKIERCYARALKRKKNLKGRVFFAWTIKKSGYVYGAKRIQGPIKDKKTINCVRGVLNKIRYERPKGKSARVVMPFLFKRPK